MQISMARRARWYVVAALTLWMGSASSAAANAPKAEAFLKVRQEKVHKLVARTPKGAPLGDKLSIAIGELLDYQELSRRALKKHWDKHSEAEREQFVGLLKQLVERSYRRNLRSTLGYQIDYLGNGDTRDGAEVRTRAQSKKNRREPPIEIDYTMIPSGDGWRVVDITTDGVSMVRNYRRQFNRILKKHGWDELIKRMQSRLDKQDVDL